MSTAEYFGADTLRPLVFRIYLPLQPASIRRFPLPSPLEYVRLTMSGRKGSTAGLSHTRITFIVASTMYLLNGKQGFVQPEIV